MMKRMRPASRYFDAILAPTLWFACLSLLYGAATIACTRQMGRSGFYASVVIIIATLFVLSWMALRPRDGSSPFASRISRLLIGIAILATLWLGFPLAMQGGSSPCAW